MLLLLYFSAIVAVFATYSPFANAKECVLTCSTFEDPYNCVMLNNRNNLVSLPQEKVLVGDQSTSYRSDPRGTLSISVSIINSNGQLAIGTSGSSGLIFVKFTYLDGKRYYSFNARDEGCGGLNILPDWKKLMSVDAFIF